MFLANSFFEIEVGVLSFIFNLSKGRQNVYSSITHTFGGSAFF